MNKTSRLVTLLFLIVIYLITQITVLYISTYNTQVLTIVSMAIMISILIVLVDGWEVD